MKPAEKATLITILIFMYTIIVIQLVVLAMTA